MELVDWQSDGPLAILALVLYSFLLVAFVTRRTSHLGPVARLIPAAIGWHLCIFAFVAFWLLPHYVASGQADAVGYYSDGMKNAELIRSGNWHEISTSLGTDIIPLLTGLLFAPAGGNIYGVFLFSAALGFSGGIYFCSAFSLWVPAEQLKSYALIVLFLPSFVTWTSIFGKDSWVCLGLGLAAYGYSLLLKVRARKGLLYFAVGLVITTAIRPHIALTVVASMALAYLWGLTQRTRGSFITKGAMAVVLLTLVGGLITIASAFIGVNDLSMNNVEAYAAQRSESNARLGNSNVEVGAAPGVTGALRAFPRGIIRVLFQPFPWEISGFNSGLAATENIFLLFYIGINARRLRALARCVSREPYLLFSFAILMLLLLLLSMIPNLGLISRERAQLLPFLFALLVAARAVRRRPLAVPALYVPAFRREAAITPRIPAVVRPRQ